MKNSIFILILFVGLVTKAQTELQLDKLAIGNILLSSLPPFAKVWIEGGGHPQIFLNNPSNPANERLWIMGAIGDEFRIMTENDNYSAVKLAMIMKRTNGINIDYVSFPEGNFGIGTTSPQEKFHVNGSIRGNAAGGSVRIKSQHGYIDVGAQNASWAHIYTDRSKIIFNKDVYTVSNAFSSYNNDLILKTKGTERLRVNDENGYVGIGTTTPGSLLNVGTKTTNSPSTVAQFGGSNPNGELNALSLVNSGGVADQATALSFHNRSSWSPTGKIAVQQNGTSTSSKLHFYTYSGGLKNRMTIDHIGNVGIGTTTPDSKLTVAGNIHSREVKVTVNAGADFVFEENYELPTLEEVQEFIKENGHLPEIASAKDMEENGIHLSEMNIKLLQKIEELTLYTIEQEKKLKVQGEEITEIKKQLVQLLNKN